MSQLPLFGVCANCGHVRHRHAACALHPVCCDDWAPTGKHCCCKQFVEAP